MMSEMRDELPSGYSVAISSSILTVAGELCLTTGTDLFKFPLLFGLGGVQVLLPILWLDGLPAAVQKSTLVKQNIQKPCALVLRIDNTLHYGQYQPHIELVHAQY